MWNVEVCEVWTTEPQKGQIVCFLGLFFVVASDNTGQNNTTKIPGPKIEEKKTLF